LINLGVEVLKGNINKDTVFDARVAATKENQNLMKTKQRRRRRSSRSSSSSRSSRSSR
jgi:hypothetical protein